MRILVTGGSGFIGRHVVTALRGPGHEVAVVDRMPFGDSDVRAVTGELEDPAVRGAAVSLLEGVRMVWADLALTAT